MIGKRALTRPDKTPALQATNSPLAKSKGVEDCL